MATATADFTGCRLVGVTTTLHCGLGFTVDTSSAGGVAGDLDVTCGVALAGREVCRLEGSTRADYVNPVSPSLGFFTVTASSTLRTTDGPFGTCPLSANETTLLSELRITITGGAGGPAPHTGMIFSTDLLG